MASPLRTFLVPRTSVLRPSRLRHIRPSFEEQSQCTCFHQHQHQQRRWADKYRKAKPELTPFQKLLQTVDENIAQKEVHYRDDEGNFHSHRDLRQLLRTIRRMNSEETDGQVWHLQAFAQHGDGMKIVKKVTAKQLREEAQRIEELALAEKRKAREEELKEIEMAWGIDVQGDLQHKLKQLKQFLENGRKVSVMLAPKKRSRGATQEQMEDLLGMVKSAAEEVEGTREYQSMEGSIGRRLILYFQAPRSSERLGIDQSSKEDKKKQKEEEKQAKREEEIRKQEKRRLQNEEKLKQMAEKRKQILGED